METLQPLYYQGRQYSERHLVALVLADIHNRVQELLEQRNIPLTLPIQGVSELIPLNPAHPMTRLLHAYMQFDEFKAFKLFPDKGLCPYVGLLLNADAGINIRSILQFNKVDGRLYVQGSYLTTLRVKHLKNAIYTLSQGKSFRVSLNAYHRVMRERLGGYHEYVHSLFAHHSRLLLIRIDLGYGEGNAVSYDEFHEDFDYFISLIQSNPIFSDLTGHIWTIEHGNSKGYHTHLLFFYDASKRHADRYIAEQIGELWMQISKQVDPSYFNCNTTEHKKRYEICCIGSIHRDDLPEIQYLHATLVPYLLKVDEFLRLTKADNRRLTGRGVSLFVTNEA